MCCTPGPLRASMRICRPLALNLQVRATRPESRRCRQCGRSSNPTAGEAASPQLFLLPQPWATCLMVRAHGRAMRVDQRRIYVHGLRERAGYATSLGTKPRRGCPPTHANSASSSCCRRSAPCAAALSVSYPIKRRARRKASATHVHVSAAGPRASEARPLLLANEECPHFLPSASSHRTAGAHLSKAALAPLLKVA